MLRGESAANVIDGRSIQEPDYAHWSNIGISAACGAVVPAGPPRVRAGSLARADTTAIPFYQPRWPDRGVITLGSPPPGAPPSARRQRAVSFPALPVWTSQGSATEARERRILNIVNEFFRRLTEGGTPWGTVDISPVGRGLWQRVRLTVYPPGTSRAERRALHFAHSWPIAGAVAGLLVIVGLAGKESPIVGLAAVLLLYLGGFWIGARLTHALRTRTRTLTVASMYVGGEWKEFGNAHLLRAATARLDDLDARRRAGQIDAVGYEAEWADVYDSLPSETPVRVRNP